MGPCIESDRVAFVQRLGYENYEEARRHARADKQTGSRLFLATATDADGRQSVAAHVAQGVANLEATFLAIGEAEIDAAATAILEARKVWVIGFRASHSFATYLQWQLTQVIENIAAIPGGGQTLGEHLVSIAPDDVVVLFGLRRRVALMEQLMAQVERTKAKLLYITDEGVPLLSGAAWHFRARPWPGAAFQPCVGDGALPSLTTRCIGAAALPAEPAARYRGTERTAEELVSPRSTDRNGLAHEARHR